MTDAEMVILPKGHPAVTPSGQGGRADGASGRGRGMKPYYERDGIIIYNADAREVLPVLDDLFDAVITDPVWPNAHTELAGADRPLDLFAEIAAHFPRLAKRAVVQLGCLSDPRFLSAMPIEMPFQRVCWLEFVNPGYNARRLNTSDVAYVFGDLPPSRPGMMVMPGRCIETKRERFKSAHPCPRNYEHVRWLVKWFARWTVLDPMMGTGTTALACKRAGLPFVGIEIDESFCAMAVDRLRQDRLWVEGRGDVAPAGPPMTQAVMA